MEATLGHRTVDAEECRRLARALRLDAVGVLHRDGEGRTLTWWAAPGAPALPLDVESIAEGRSDGWIVSLAGEDVVVGRPTGSSSVRSVETLRRLLSEIAPSANGSVADPQEDPLDRERARWAYAIHDGLTQILTALILDLEWRGRQVGLEPSSGPAALSEAASELRSALEEVRSILAVVTPEGSALSGAASLAELVERVAERWHVPASWSVDGDLERVPAEVMEAATSVIREGVANAAKHSSARRIAVHVQARPTEMEVSVEDTGRGFRPQENAGAKGHLGLAMMRRRVEELRGTLDIQSEPGRGTRVVARLPVGEGETP